MAGRGASTAEELADVSQSESAQLVPPASGPTPVTAPATALNLLGNACALTLVAVLAYYAFLPGASLFSFHPVLMSLGWLIFMTSAINAVTPGDYATEWMPIRLRSARHWVIQVITLSLIIAGFIVIIANKINMGKPHFVSLHAIFGLSSIVLMLVTSLGGICTLYSLKLKQLLPPAVTKMIHSSAGLATFCLGLVTIILGLFTKTVSDEIGRYFSLLLVLIVGVCTVARPSVKLYVRFRERLGYARC